MLRNAILLTVVVALAGCGKAPPSSTSALRTLDDLISKSKTSNPMHGRRVEDLLLYSDGTRTVWLRKLSSNEVPAVIGDRNFAHLFVFEGEKLQGSFPVDVTNEPFMPDVFPRAGSVFVTSYLYADQPEGAPPRYIAQVHRIDSTGKYLLHEEQIQALHRDAADEVAMRQIIVTLPPDGPPVIVRLKIARFGNEGSWTIETEATLPLVKETEKG